MKKKVLISVAALAVMWSTILPGRVYATEVDSQVEPVVEEDVELIPTDTDGLLSEGEELLIGDELVEPVVTPELDDEGISCESEFIEWEDDGLTSDEMLLGYLYKEAGVNNSYNDKYPYNGYTVRSYLSPIEQSVYDAFRTQIEMIARGQESSSVIYADVADFGIPTSSIYDYVDIAKVVWGIKKDCPYDFYWVDLGFNYGYSYGGGIVTQLRVSLRVNGSYRGSSIYTTNLTKTSATYIAINNAQGIVNRAVGLGDYDKLKYYADTICELVDYNHPAVNNNYSYGDPWQLIWVFDGDPSTKVVCEGYSKAFQLLCDMSSFNSPLTRCLSVTGTVYFSPDNGGGHEWNVVRMDDGRNYLVDVTNMDSCGDWLFLAPAYAGSYDSSYYFTDGRYENWEYTYYDPRDGSWEDLTLFSPADISISMTKYSRLQLVRDRDGVYRLYDNNVFKSDYNDLYGDSALGWVKIKNGVLDSGYNDLYWSPTMGWWKIKNGGIDFGYTDMFYSPQYGWWKINGGAMDSNYNDLYYSPTIGWWKVANGTLDVGYNDIYCSPSQGWYKINGGTIDYGYTDMFFSPQYGWLKVVGGAVDFGYNDLYCSPTIGWWKVANGTLDVGYTDLFGSNILGWMKVVEGRVDFGYNDLYWSPTQGWWKISSGAIDFGYNDMFYSPNYGWWKIKGGSMDTEYNDLFNSPTIGWWKIANGTLDVGYNDLYWSPTMGWYKVAGGRVDFGYNDMFYSPNYGWWKVTYGAMDTNYTDLFCSPTIGWWKIKNGTLDVGYNDMYYSPNYGWWKINGGSMDFGYTDAFCSPTIGWWKIVGGTIDIGYTGKYKSPLYNYTFNVVNGQIIF